MNGIIVIDKPQGMTSHDVVSFLRRKTGVRRIGHSGTLDPMATGVLPVFIGKATRMIEYTTRPGDPEAKKYHCRMKLGLETDTLDIWGTPIAAKNGAINGEQRMNEDSPIFPEKDEIERVLKGFEGAGVQKPPMYAAVKVGGKKLYEYARKGETPDESLIKERNIYIKHISVNEIDEVNHEVQFDVVCSKGVYIRTLCADAGRQLGCGAVMSGLVRLWSDGFSIDEAVSVDALRDDDVSMPPLLPADAALSWLPRADLDEGAAGAFVQGQKVKSIAIETPQQYTEIARVYGPEGFLGMGMLLPDGYIKPKKVLI